MSVVRRFAACATLVLLTTASSPPVRPANYDAFGVATLTWLMAQSKTENVFISPASIGIALAMTAEGAAGSTRTAILRSLQSDGRDLALENAALIAALGAEPDATIGLADAIWLRQDLPPRPTYVNLLQSNYHAQVAALHFGDPSAAAAINAWTKAHTLGLIDQLVQNTYRFDFAYLTNALAFKGTWSLPFTNRTQPGPFTDAGGKRHNVSIMSQTASFMTFDAPTYRVLRLPYGKSGGCAAYVILPGATLENAVQQLSGANFERLAHGLALGQVLVALPRFTAKYDASLKPVLGALGMGITFDDGADFTPMRAPPPRLFIVDVNHASYVQVDEAGTTAVAATSVEMGFRGPRPIPPKSFVVDRPFVLGIRDENAGTWLFIGAIRTLPPS